MMTKPFPPTRHPARHAARLLAALPLTLCAALAMPAAQAAPGNGGDPPPSYKMKSGRMMCGEHLRMDVQAEGTTDARIRLTWKGRHYVLVRKPTSTGAYHFDDDKAGLVMIQIPTKSMLFDNKHMTRLADDCNPVAGTRLVASK